jgi:FAD/FMN-containing dehydrogenase
MNADTRETTAGVHARVLQQLESLLGAAQVLRGDRDRRFYAQDVYSAGTPPLAVLRPGTVAELQAAVRAATDAGLAVYPRGGGMSYTSGFQPESAASVTIDLGRLDRIVAIDLEDRYVTVECGATWKQLADALEPHGLRTPYWGPLSGLRSTIGGALSQGSIFLGSGLHGPAQESLLGLEVVLADGRLMQVGGASIRCGEPFFRHHGPDLSGLFTGDCGALGIKARATLRLLPAPAASLFLSFSFAAADALYAVMADVAREGLAAECFAFDPGLQAVRMKRVSLAEDVKSLGKVVKSAGGVLAGLKEGARIVLAGRNFLDEEGFSLHLGIDGRDAADADARAARVRQLCAAHAREVENTIPKVMRASPFMEVNSMLGPGGERWVPVHGVVPLSQGRALHAACEAVFAAHAEECQRLAIDHGYLSCTVGDRALLVEPVFYWPDERLEYHERVLDSAYLAKLETHPANPVAREAVARIRGELADRFVELGAVSFQLGRFYRYQQGLADSAAGLLAALKRELDPRGLMNPGALGLPR